MGNEADTIGESLFEAYLISQGYTDFVHEQECEGKSKKPDYTVHINNEDFLFEVKDFVQTKPFPQRAPSMITLPFAKRLMKRRGNLSRTKMTGGLAALCYTT
jgi:hypothetical protein